jgi:hypothetical protein
METMINLGRASEATKGAGGVLFDPINGQQNRRPNAIE